jgi:hypothetical protein
METVFSTMGSISAEHGIVGWLLGRKDHMSFEMVAHKDKISFYISIPKKQHQFIEEQIHAQYPNAQIEEVPDYNMFGPTSVILGSYVVFKRADCFPLRTYRKLETDSMNSLTNALSKVDAGDGASIQYVIRSAPKKWSRDGLEIAKGMQQGKRLEDVERHGFFGTLAHVFRGIGSAVVASEQKPGESYHLSPLESEMIKGLEEKSSKAGLEVNIRVLVSAKTPEKAQRYLNDILNAYGQFNIYEYGNSLAKEMPVLQTRLIRHFIFRRFDESYKLILNAEEMASIFHLPLPSTETPKINWLLSRKALPPPNLPSEGIMLGLSEYRGYKYEVRMKQPDRRRHMYIIGKSGSGKSVFQASLIKQDIEAGSRLCWAIIIE